MILKCSKCGGKIDVKKTNEQTTFSCNKCGAKRIVINEKIIDMSETSKLEVITEYDMYN